MSEVASVATADRVIPVQHVGARIGGYLGLWLLAHGLAFAVLLGLVGMMPDGWVGDQGAGFGWAPLIALGIAPFVLAVGVALAVAVGRGATTFRAIPFFAWSLALLVVVHVGILALFGWPT